MAAHHRNLLRASVTLALTTIIPFIGVGFGADLQPTFSFLDKPITEVFLPNVRESVDDCHMRYYKYGKNYNVFPISNKPAFLREFAHMTAIGWMKANNTIVWNCGGALIWENYVLTAAHCAADDDNQPPDVVRLGDINLYDDTDDQYAQQLKIVEIIRHPEHRFSTRYHDLALLRLQRNVVLHDTVAPACLWNDENIPFTSMESAGWGARGIGKSKTPILLKVSLNVTKKEECDKHYRAGERGLKQGLQSHQLCAGDVEMDTCPGDSGGPLGTKLLHRFKATPFVVAITSFGKACGQSVPGVYTKVAPYIPWIGSVLAKRGEDIKEWSFKPKACSTRYYGLRDFEDAVISYKYDGVESYSFEGAYMGGKRNRQTVRIHWPVDFKGPDNCYGVVIDEDAILTVARCAVVKRTYASHIVVEGSRREISQVIQHPMYVLGSLYNDIAVLKLMNPFQFSSGFFPACIWSAFELPSPRFYVSGQDRIELYEQQEFSETDIRTVVPRTDIQNGENCTISEAILPGLNHGLTQEHLCFDNKIFLVPETCELRIGAPIYHEVWRFDKYLDHIYGLNIYGRDCGFGTSALATRIGYHLKWLNSVLLPNYWDKSNAVKFYDSELMENDHCFGVDGSEGLCVEISRCPKIAYDIEVNRNVRFCATGSVVCCPYHNIKNQTIVSSAAEELDDCDSRYQLFHRQYEKYPSIDHFFHMVGIGWKKDGRIFWFCRGSVVTLRIVITSAYCIKSEPTRPTVVNIAEGSPAEAIQRPKIAYIEDIFVHPLYSLEGISGYNIALVRLKKDIIPTTRKYPICLWQNETHTPFKLQQVIRPEGKGEMFAESYPNYISDCQTYTSGYNPLLVCVNVYENDPTSVTGSPLVWYGYNVADNTTTQYLVGIATIFHKKEPVSINVRISSLIGWIKSVL